MVVSDCLMSSNHGVNMVLLNEMIIYVLCAPLKHWVRFFSVNSLKQEFAYRYASSHGHIIIAPTKPVFVVTLYWFVLRTFTIKHLGSPVFGGVPVAHLFLCCIFVLFVFILCLVYKMLPANISGFSVLDLPLL
jgi:uncharacterized membrane protein (DUF485 family)